jgi:group II intron reverse transcriptase/maturase
MHIYVNLSSEKDLKNLQDFLYAQSQGNKTFTGLLEAVESEVTIVTAIHNIKSNKGSKTAGVDKIKTDRYLQMPKEEVVTIVQSNLRKYLPKPARRVYIDKSNGKKRPLGIPTILDRIIQECIRIVIEPICEARFYPHSYGFRPYRAQKHAIADICHTLNAPAKPENKAVFALEGDIKGCFDNINHRILLRKLWKIGVHDKRILTLIRQMLKAGYIEYDLFLNSAVGVQQGGIISPLLSNVYLNDFDWHLGRQYFEPVPKRKRKGGDMERLRQQGITPKYNFRFADDWIVLTTKSREAERLKKKLTKYFKHRLKLELSEEKTKITDMRRQGAEFLGFVIRAEKSRTAGKDSSNLVGKPYPNMKRLSAKITNVCQAIHAMKRMKSESDRVAQIQYVNSMIMGIAEYIKISVCSKAFSVMDHRIYVSCHYVWKRLYPGEVLQMKVPLGKLNNLPHRHEGYTAKTHAIFYQGMWIGVTMAFITHSQHEKFPMNQKMTPYTAEGRNIYIRQRKNQKPLPMNRPSVNDADDLRMSAYKSSIYNFEYFMNREYAFNRDKCKCRCCGVDLTFRKDRHCHHVNRRLPMDKINKVPNLAWVCRDCHQKIHSCHEPMNVDAKVKKKILKFREKLDGAESVSEERP